MNNRSTKLVARKAVESLYMLLSKFSVCSKTRRKPPIYFSLLFLFATLSSPVSATIVIDGSLQSNSSPSSEETSSVSLAREIVFIDAAVEDQSLLIKAVRPDAEVVLLSSDADGVSQIAQSLRGRSDISAIHIVSHGQVGQLILGTSNLNSNTLRSYLSEINTISAALSKDADILLYGCNVAQGDSGKAFIGKFAEMTSADVAASNNVTGDAGKGGDWVLESSQGEVQVGVMFSQKGLAGYKQLLATPVITSTVVTSVDEDAGYSYTISATDSDLHTLTYSAPTLPGWLNFDPGTRQLTGTPTNANVGTHSVTLRVNDGTVDVDQSFTITVSNTNDAPVITSTEDTAATEDAAYSYTITATDVDGDTLTYSAPTVPTWLSFNTISHVLSGTPTNADVGNHSVTLRVNDGTVNVDQSFIITVSNTNDAPVITSTEDTTAPEDAAYSYTITATDADGDSLTYSAPTIPSWLSFSASTRGLTGTPTNANVGNHSVTLRVNDGTVNVDQSFTITVSNTNDAPQITSTGGTTATEDAAYSYTITATDADGDSLTYSALATPSWLSFSASTQKLTGTPTNGDVGNHSVVLRVSDGTVDVDQSFTVTVSNTNDAPQITSIGNTTAPEDAAYSYTITATDADGDSLTYSAPTIPSWLSFSASTQKLTGTPANANVGNHSVTLRVNDGTVNVDQNFTITVSNTNDAPVITSNADTAAPEDAPYSYTITATDADGDSLTYSAPTIPSWLSFNAGTRQLTGTPTNANVGNHSIVLRVYDGVENVDQNFTITVSNTNDGPQITSNADTTAPEDAAYSYTITATDVDGDILTYSAPTTPSWLSFSASTQKLTGTPTNANVGNHSVVLRVSDGTTNVDQGFTITVSNTNDAPQITSTGDTTAPEDAAYSYTITATDVDGDSLTYSAPTIPGWLSFNAGTRQLTGTPTNADVGNHSVTLRVSDGTVSVDQNFTITVSNTNDTPVITSNVDTTAPEDAPYSYTITATDADGDSLTYSAPTTPSWLSFNAGTRQLTGTPTNANVGDHNVVLRVSDGVISVNQSFTITVSNVNDAPTGKPVIGGSVIEDATLSVDTSSIFDEDGGVNGFAYQWKSGGVNVSVSSTYTLQQTDVGNTITVAVTYTDNGGTTETVISDAKGPVANVNDKATGQPVIVGTLKEDQTLSVDTSGIGDEDGGVNGFTYQWKSDGVIVGSSGTYILTQSEVNKTMTVTVIFTDDGGTIETVTSNASILVINVNDDPVGIPTIIGNVSKRGVLTADTSHITDEDGINVGAFNYQWVRNEINIPSATSVSYTLVQSDVGNAIKVVVKYLDNGGKTETVTSLATGLVSNNNALPVGKPVITGIVKENELLGVDTSGISDLDGGVDNFSYQWKSDGENVGTSPTYQLLQNDVGKVITVFVTYVDNGDTTETVVSEATVAVVNVNDIPTGQPIIIGDAVEGSVLTVDTTTIDDVDGLGDFSYQWLRNGIEIPILEGGVDLAYTLVQADVATQISIVVSFTDGGGLLESVTSLPTVAVVNVNDPPVGLPIIIGSPVQGGVLTVDTLSITDIDVLGEFSYQWLRDGTAIPDAIASSYTLVQADVGTFISIVVSYIDGQLTLESVFSETLGPVSNVNDPGVVIIDSTPEAGLAIDGELLSVVSLTDIDGISNATNANSFEYRWLRDGVEIPGEIGESYRLRTIDLRTFISLRVTYTDDLGENEVVTSDGIGPIFPDVPKVFPPDAVGPFVSTGWFTFVEIEKTSQATATDGFDGALIPFSDTNGQFRPGVTGVIWSAIDSADNVGTAIQEVKMIPLVDINKGQISAEGANVQVKVALNGKAINYPVTIPYTVGGSADSGDHTLIGGSVVINEPSASALPEGFINFAINIDGLTEGTETVVITLGAPDNAVLGLVKTHTVQIVEGNVAPLVSLSANQSSVGMMLKVDPNGGQVVVAAMATDVNGNNLAYDWSGTDASIVNMDVDGDTGNEIFTFNPVDVGPGYYTFHVSVSDGSASVNASLVLEVLEQTPMLTTKDSDGDGIVDYLDTISASHILQQKQSVSNAFLIQTEPGLKLSLGETAFKANNSQSMVTSQDVVDYAFSGVTGIELVDEIENIGGYFDFIVSGLPIAGQSVQIVLPQLAPLPKIPVYRKLTSTGWKDFVKDEKNTIASTAGSEGYCPPPGDAAYQPGLSEGRWCVLLTIEDGGPNDLDGVVNNSVTDPGGVSRFLTNVSVISSGGGGGAVNPLWLLSVFFMLLYYRNVKYLVR